MLHAALIGFPASGKSTLFQLMTSTQENPRSKGDIAIGISKVPDTRLDVLCDIYNPKKRAPATVEFTDILTMARGGTQSLVDVASYRNADALVHVVRAFRDNSVPHPSGSIDPVRDAQAMEDELLLADLGVIERRLERLAKDLKRSYSNELEHEQQLIQRCRTALEEGTPLRALKMTSADLKQLRGFQLLSAKPLLLVINLDEKDLTDVGVNIEKVADRTGLTKFLARAATTAVAVYGKIELEIAQLESLDASVFLQDLGLNESGLDRVIQTSYDLLGYLSFFTVGEDECRAWSIPKNTPAQIAAREIHGDISRGFIRAEVVDYKSLTSRGSMPICREHGEVRLEGKEYIVKDGDIINFRFAT